MKILLEYDSGAVEGVEELDETYNFRIGYSWWAVKLRVPLRPIAVAAAPFLLLTGRRQ